MSYQEVRDLLFMNLSASDWKKVERYQMLFDIRNIKAFWMNEPLDGRGNLGEKELEEALLVQDVLPTFVSDFLDRFDSQEDRYRYFPSLYASLFLQFSEEGDGFLKKLFQMEREIRLCLVALRANANGKDLTRELQFEDPTDPLVSFLLAQKESEEPVLPKEYEDLKAAFLENRSDPKKLHRANLKIRLERIEEMEELQTYSIDQVLGYLARLAIVEDWARLDYEQGRLAVEHVCRSS